MGSIEEVFDEVEKERATFGIVPVENSMEGSVGGVLDAFLKSDLCISSELFERVSHFLISRTGNLSDIRVVASHPQALRQCKIWLSKHIPHAELRETASTTRAAILLPKTRKSPP